VYGKRTGEIMEFKSYKYKHLDAEKTLKIPFEAELRVNAGRLNTAGLVQNNPPPSKHNRKLDALLLANIDNQTMFSVPNPYHRRLSLYIAQEVARTSYDWRLKFPIRGDNVVGLQRMGNTRDVNQFWFNDGMSTTVINHHDGAVPYGENLDIEIQCDNNDATNDIVLNITMLLYDPAY
jgi:hypothetical protein